VRLTFLADNLLVDAAQISNSFPNSQATPQRDTIANLQGIRQIPKSELDPSVESPISESRYGRLPISTPCLVFRSSPDSSFIPRRASRSVVFTKTQNHFICAQGPGNMHQRPRLVLGIPSIGTDLIRAHGPRPLHCMSMLVRADVCGCIIPLGGGALWRTHGAGASALGNTCCIRDARGGARREIVRRRRRNDGQS
jgi:hypothetical protein